MSIRILAIITCFIVSCNSFDKRKKIKDKTINKITILLSGRGREIPIFYGFKDTIIPEELSSQVYLFELNQQGNLTASLGFGQVSWNDGSDTNDIKLKGIDSKDSTCIKSDKKQKILSIAERLYKQDSYRTKNHPTDSWIVKLTLNNKSSIYYVGEDISNNDESINNDYRDIIDLIVKESPIIIREYR